MMSPWNRLLDNRRYPYLPIVSVSVLVLLICGWGTEPATSVALFRGADLITGSALQPEQISAVQGVFRGLPGTHSAVVALPHGEHVSQDADRPLRSASVIKLWIAGAALQAAAGGRLDLGELHVLTPQEQATGTGVLNQARFVGRSYSYSGLIDTMLVYSDNTAANIIVNRIGGYGAVNDYAQAEGYARTLMQRDLGSIDAARDNYTSAHDLALFMERLLNGVVVNRFSTDFILTSLQTRRTKEDPIYDYFGRLIPNYVDYIHISGLNPGIRNDLGYYVTSDGPVIVAIMMQDLSNDAQDENSLSRAVRAIYDLYPTSSAQAALSAGAPSPLGQ